MPGDRQGLRLALQRVASPQRGYFTAAQARSVGYSYQAQKFHADHGNWEHVGRGLYRLPAWPIQIDDHLVRWSVWSGERAVISHDSALAEHDLGDVNPARLHLTVPRAFGKSDDAVVLHRLPLDQRDIETRDGYRLTTPARALAEATSNGLAVELARGALAEGTARGLFDVSDVVAVAGRISSRAASRVRRILVALGPLSRPERDLTET